MYQTLKRTTAAIIKITKCHRETIKMFALWLKLEWQMMFSSWIFRLREIWDESIFQPSQFLHNVYCLYSFLLKYILYISLPVRLTICTRVCLNKLWTLWAKVANDLNETKPKHDIPCPIKFSQQQNPHIFK